jgi:nicotinamide-nucleotide amidase
MRAEVVSIGDELTSGQRLDTNSQWLSQQLGDLGIEVMYHSTVGDDLAANIRVFREAFARADLVVCTGGLGPTADDLTRQVIADATGTELVLDEPALEHIRQLFTRRGREMPARNQVQAEFPKGSRVVPNPHGSAPGIDMDIVRDGTTPSRVFALPGVPAEMKEMWEQTVHPELCELLGSDRNVIHHYSIKCFGIGESDMEAKLPDLIRRRREPRVGITVSKATITLRITAAGKNIADCEEQMTDTIETIRECVGDLIFGYENDELQDAIVRLLNERKESLATAECDAGGLLARWLTEASSADDHYLGGTVYRHPRTRLIGSTGSDAPDDERLMVERMAVQCRDQFEADWGLAIGPFPNIDPSKEQQFVQVAIANSEGVQAAGVIYAGHPDILEARAVKYALDRLRKRLK